MPKRGYFVWVDGDEIALAVVATSVREAKRIAFNDTFHTDYDWIDVRCKWARYAAAKSSPLGIMVDPHDALIRGIYDAVFEYPCDECGIFADVICYGGRALCARCIEKNPLK